MHRIANVGPFVVVMGGCARSLGVVLLYPVLIIVIDNGNSVILTILVNGFVLDFLFLQLIGLMWMGVPCLIYVVGLGDLPYLLVWAGGTWDLAGLEVAASATFRCLGAVELHVNIIRFRRISFPKLYSMIVP